jgi:Fur family ferric uptake transcriptional regulator
VDGTRVGQRQTAQRRAILKVIREAHGPMTVEDIHKQAKGTRRNLGIATVYRTVKLLLQSKHIKPITLPDGETRYEPAALGHHCYFYCRRCRQVYDLPMCAVSIPNGTTLPGGYRVDGHDLTLHGYCPECSRARKKR